MTVTNNKTTRKRAPKAGTDLVVVSGVTENTLRSVTLIRKDITKISQTDVGMDIAAHNLAVECLQHADQHGDFTLFAQLVGDVSTAGGASYGRGLRSRRLGLIEWASKFSPIRINGDGVIGLLSKTAKNYVAFNVTAAEETPFYDLGGEASRRAQNKPFNIEVMLKRIGGFEKAIDKASELGTLEGPEEALKSLARDMTAEFAKRARALGLLDEANKATATAAA